MLSAATYSAVELLRNGRKIEIRALRTDDHAAEGERLQQQRRHEQNVERAHRRRAARQRVVMSPVTSQSADQAAAS